jgi:hypothetical protein
VRVLVYLTPLVALCACATSEEVPRFGSIDGAVVADDGGLPGGQGNGAVPNTGGRPGNGGSPNGGGSPGGAAGTCAVASCPSCSATFGQACCRDNGMCGCKALFGLLNCM